MKADFTLPAWQLARRAARMNPSLIREMLKVTERGGVLSMAGGLPSPDTFPVEAVRDATARVLAHSPREALQYAGSEGFEPLCEWLAEDLATRGLRVDAARILITTGSQQGLDLVAKVLIDAGSTVAVESPTYLGALQAFNVYEPRYVAVECDDDGPLPQALYAASEARFLYLLPNFQNPSGRCIGGKRRDELVTQARRLNIPLVEDDPYGELWFDEPPPAPLASRWTEGTIYLGTFSKVLAPGLRLGYVIAPEALHGKLLQAKQAADLHTSGFNQRIVHEVIKHGFLSEHVPAIRARYRVHRDAMAAALAAHMPPSCRWNTPKGGMFFWVELPQGVDASALLPKALALGIAFVPGAAFFAGAASANTLRLSFVTLNPEQIERAIRLLAQTLAENA